MKSKHITLVLIFSSLSLALYLGYLDRHQIDGDGFQYLEIAEAYLRGNWSQAINAYWAPLYTWFLALTFAITTPTPYYKFATAHFLQLLIYTFTLLSFHQLQTKLYQFLQPKLHPNLWLIFSYSLFTWATLTLTTMFYLTPDLLMAAFFYLSVSFFLDLTHSKTPPPSHLILLGLTLGLGYLSKSPFFPISILFFCSLALLFPQPRLRHLLFVLIPLLLLSLPYITTISLKHHQLLFSSNAPLNYTWKVNHQSTLTRTQFLSQNPPIYTFPILNHATYPIWFDPTSYHTISTPSLNLQNQLQALTTNSILILDIIQPLLIPLLLILTLSLPIYTQLPPKHLFLLAIPLISLSMFTPIAIRPRYAAPFITTSILILTTLTLSSTKLPYTQSIKLLAVLLLAVLAAKSTRQHTLHQRLLAHTHTHPIQISQFLLQNGLQPNDSVATIGHPLATNFLYLADLKITAQLEKSATQDFWQNQSTLQPLAFQTFQQASVSAIIAIDPPPNIDTTHWTKIPHSHHYLHLLNHPPPLTP